MYLTESLFSLAKSSFKEASRLAPKDAVPLSNLSAVEFELGNYVGCSLFSQKALGLLELQEGTEAMKQKILLRLTKAYMHISKLDDAASVLTKLNPSEARSTLEQSLTQAQLLQKEFPEENALRMLFLDRLPRYRPSL
jgi:hypothetical protein